MKKINFKSKGFVTLVACLCLAAGAVSMVALTQNKNRTDALTTTATEVRAEVKGIKDTTRHTVSATGESFVSQPPAENNSTGLNVPSTSMEARENNKPYASYFMYPINESISKEYSGSNLVYSQTMGDYRSHNGIDFQGKEGDNIKAIADGIVLSVTQDELWGTTMEIDHGHNMIVRYSGFKTTTIEKGHVLAQGDSLGTLGGIPVEAADGSHLHLEIRIEGKLVNPMEAMHKVSGDDADAENSAQ